MCSKNGKIRALKLSLFAELYFKQNFTFIKWNGKVWTSRQDFQLLDSPTVPVIRDMAAAVPLSVWPSRLRTPFLSPSANSPGPWMAPWQVQSHYSSHHSTDVQDAARDNVMKTAPFFSCVLKLKVEMLWMPHWYINTSSGVGILRSAIVKGDLTNSLS